MAEINVTPFVDVMLVLLIIFMVTAPMMQQGVDVNLPETTTQPLRLQDEPLILSVEKDGSTFLANEEVPSDALREKLGAIVANRGEEAVYLRADREAPYGAVARAMAAARMAGVKSLGIVTEPE